MRFCTSYFPLQEKLCRNNVKYIFGVCFALQGTLFLCPKKATAKGGGY